MYRLIFILLFSVTLNAQEATDSLNFTDAHGLKQGKWMKYFQGTDKKRYEGQFLDNKPVGTFKYYYTTGQIRNTLTHRKDGKSKAKYFHPDGTVMALGIYVGEQKDSTWTYFNELGETIALEYYIVGKRYGNFTKFYGNGDLLEEKYFENNLENGPFKQYYENGMIMREGTYVNGSLEGPGVFYHNNGVVRFEGEYYKDTKNGIWKTYDESGNLLNERNYIKGIPEGWENDILLEDSTKYYKKDKLEITDFIEEDYMAIPEEKGKKKKK